MFRSATFKLTLWYLAIVMCLSIIFSLVLYHVATVEIAGGLHRESERFINEFPDFSFQALQPPSDEISYRAHRLLMRLVALNIIVFILAGLISYLLARRTLQPIEAAHEQQKRFTSDVSHELRTPLTALRMESEVALLNPKATASELRSTLTSNLEEVAKLENLINNLLKLSRLETDELQQQFTAISITDIAARAIKTVEPMAKQHRLTIENNSTAAQVMGDQDSLVQLLVILLDNAIKYSPSRSVVSIASRHRSHEVIIQVTDHGEGIAAEDLEHIMERFYRPDSSRAKTRTSGYGLGLSIAQMIVEIHQGSIHFESKEKQGTTVTIQLPAARA